MSIKVLNRKKGKVYQAIVDLPTGKQICKIFPRKRDAEMWESAQRLMIDSGQVIESRRMTFGEYYKIWSKNQASLVAASSMKRYDSYFKVIFDGFHAIRLMNMKPIHIENWRNKLLTEDGYSQKSVRDVLGLLKKILNDAVNLKYLVVSPASLVAMPKIPERDFDFWTEAEANRFLEYIHLNEPGFYSAYLFALNTGMRLGELQELRWDCISVDRCSITVKRTYCTALKQTKETTKGKKIRTIPMNRRLVDEVKKLRACPRGELVLPPVDWRKMYRYTRKFAKRAGVKSIRFHDLRHTFASIFMMNGGTIYNLQKILGHASIAMTERYSHLSPDHLKGATDIIDIGIVHERKVFPIVAIQSA